MTRPAATDEAADKKATDKAMERYRKLASEREKFMKEDVTGFVWLYLQK